MSKPPKIGLWLVAVSVLIAALIISASLLASSATRQTVTKTEIETMTLTPNAEIEPNGSLLLSKTWGPWVYDVSINSTSVGVGEALLVSGELTYHGQANITIDEVEPIDSFSAYNSTGGMVWAYEPSEINFEATITPGEMLGGGTCIPITATLTHSSANHGCQFAFREPPVPGVYSIETVPGFYSYSGHENLGNNLQIIASFTVF